MSNDNQAVENNSEDQEAPKTEVEQIAEAKEKMHFFDETASVVEEGGEINTLIDKLYAICKEKEIPMFLGVVHKVEDCDDAFNVEIRGSNTSGKNGFAPPSLRAARAVLEHESLANMILHIAGDEVKMGMLEMIEQLKG